jgi:hypothetical protein
MNSPKLSRFFSERKISDRDNIFCDVKNKKMTLNEYSASKNVRNMFGIDSDRSICQMLRNINGMTQYTNHEDVVLLVNFANNAVLKLGTYSKNPGNRWGGRKTRSDFTEEKREMGLFYLNNPHHSSFQKLKSLYDRTTDQRVADYIVEISYYMERINSKILEYEQKATP